MRDETKPTLYIDSDGTVVSAYRTTTPLRLPVREAVFTANPGDWIVARSEGTGEDVSAEASVVAPETFEAEYSPYSPT